MTGVRPADAVSLALNPSLWSGGFVAFLAIRTQPAGTPGSLIAVVGFVTVALLPIASLFGLKATGRLSDIEMRRQDERGAVYRTCALVYAAGALVLLALGATWPVWGLVTLHVPYALVLAILNRHMKVSIHATGLAGVAAAGLVCFGSEAWPLVLVAGAGSWARWNAGAHTLRELATGAAVGGVLTGAGLEALRRLAGG